MQSAQSTHLCTAWITYNLRVESYLPVRCTHGVGQRLSYAVCRRRKRAPHTATICYVDMMADFDEDTPPPLGALAEQVQALKLATRSADTAARNVDLPVATTTVVEKSRGGDHKPGNGLKKGFFSAKKTGGSVGVKASDNKDVIPHIKAKKVAEPLIPEAFRLKPDDQQQKYEAYKSQLTKALQPTPDTILKIQSDEQLLAGFDDPEVMAAVADIAKNPQNYRKYANNPKVVKFYAAMGQVMGDKLQAQTQSK